MNILRLAHKRMGNEGLLNRPNESVNLIDRMVAILKYLDKQNRADNIALARSK